MKLKYKKILAQILSVAVAGSNFVAPVVCTNSPVISVNAEEYEENTEENYEESTDEEYIEDDYSEEEYSDDDYSEEEYSDEEYYEEDYSDEEYIEDEYSEDEEYFEEDDTYETDELNIEDESSGNKIEIGVEYGGSYVQGSVSSGIPSRYMNTFIMNEDGSASFSAFSGGTVDRIDFTDSVYENGVYNLSGGSYIYGSQGVVQTNVTGTITVNDDSSISFSSSKLTMGADYLSDDNMVIIDKTTTTTTGTTTETSTETTTETITTTTAKEPTITYEWYVEPSVKADDINSVGVFMESISDKEDYEYNYGQFADTGYAIVKDGDFYGVIDMDGNEVIESNYVLIRGAINEHFRLYDEEGRYVYFCCETGEYLDPQEPYCAWCERTLVSDVCSSYYCYDPDRDLLAYIGIMPKTYIEEDSISLDGQNCSGTTIDFPEGKTIPVRMVSIESDDEVILTDSYGIMRDGEIIVDFNYDNALSFKDGITALEQDGEWYYYDEDGYQIIENSCEASYYFNVSNEDYIPYLPSDEYIAFNTAYGGGYYSTDGGVVIPVGEFAEVRPVFNGLAWVKDHATGLWGVIQLTGERADAPEDNDNDSDSEDGEEDGDNENNSSSSSSSSSGSSGKASPKTGDDFGSVFALLALSLGVMVISAKRREK